MEKMSNTNGALALSSFQVTRQASPGHLVVQPILHGCKISGNYFSEHFVGTGDRGRKGTMGVTEFICPSSRGGFAYFALTNSDRAFIKPDEFSSSFSSFALNIDPLLILHIGLPRPKPFETGAEERLNLVFVHSPV